MTPSFHVDASMVKEIRAGTVKPEELVLQKSANANGHVWEIKKASDPRAIS